jgi:hypothetical protein
MERYVNSHVVLCNVCYVWIAEIRVYVHSNDSVGGKQTLYCVMICFAHTWVDGVVDVAEGLGCDVNYQANRGGTQALVWPWC